ncbi:hypothetical protein C0J52_20188 [Blattella germanica]|nr:hypothetical protein C0J52_20188 [Blattella germanica]
MSNNEYVSFWNCILDNAVCLLSVVFLLLQYGRAPIHWASSRGNTDIMEMLIAAKCDIEAKDKAKLQMQEMSMINAQVIIIKLLSEMHRAHNEKESPTISKDENEDI